MISPIPGELGCFDLAWSTLQFLRGMGIPLWGTNPHMGDYQTRFSLAKCLQQIGRAGRTK
jgi:hypothetical protein